MFVYSCDDVQIAVTAPENNNIQLGPGVSGSTIRKELIQCGKILNGFCSEADFSQKEPTLVLVNEFLARHKTDFKLFVNAVCAAGVCCVLCVFVWSSFD